MDEDFSPSGLITLTTDFGPKGPFVGVMKGVLLDKFEKAQIIDLTHEILPHFPGEAGFWIERSFRYFPKGSVHIAVVDPGVGSQRRILIAALEGHVFIAPDNGLLAPICDQAKVFRFDLARAGARLGIHQTSATFHGRDIFAPLGAAIASGKYKAHELGAPTKEWIPSWLEEPKNTRVGGLESIEGCVVTFDHFGNIITNIQKKYIEHKNAAQVRTGGLSFPLVRTYSDVKPGDYLALINSFDVIEIARAERNAQEGLGVERGAPVIVEING